MSPALLDPDHLRRAVDLGVEALPNGAHLVSGEGGPHVVTANRCDCPTGHTVCTHRLALFLRALPRLLVDAMPETADGERGRA